MPLEDVRQDAIGDDLYRFHDSSRQQRQCAITAHGMKSYPTPGRSMGLGHEHVRLHYYTPHGFVTIDKGVGALSRGLVIHETLSPDDSPDYFLSKYTNSEIGASGSHKHNDQNEAYKSLKYSAGQDGTRFDIISIRNRHRFNLIRLSTVLKALWAANLEYEEIHCYFCRGSADPV